MAQPASSVPLHINTQLDLNLGPRFVDVRPRGCGANGFVYSAVDTDCDKKVAIKRITFGDSVTCKYALREIKVMRRLQHENIISTWEVLGMDGKSLEDDSAADLTELFSVYIIEELLHTDLHHVIQSQQMKMEHVGFFTYQLLRGLKYLHSANVVHRDLKPSNILINCDDMMLKIGDFGLARVIDPNYGHDGVLTENMGTAWYRSPEQILHPKTYNKAVDIWSAGCIFAEMLTGRPIFRGVDDLDQLLQILDTVILMDDDWDKVLTLISNKVLQNHPLKIVVPLSERLAFVDREAVDLLVSLLTFSPKLRMTAEEALYQPYFREYSNGRDEPVALHPLYIEHEDDNQPLSVMKQMIVEEVNSSHRCGSQMDWGGWEALHALQLSTATAAGLDNNGNVSPTESAPSILECHSEAKQESSTRNISEVFFKKEIYPCDDFTYAKCLSKETDIPEFELNEKYQEDEKERRELSPRKWEEEKSNEIRRCLVAAASPSAIQPCDNHLISKCTESYEDKNSEENDQDADPSITSLPLKSSPADSTTADEEDMEKYVEDINKKNNAINACNISRSTYIEEYNEQNDLNEPADDLDIFSLGKQKKNRVTKYQAFKDQFNLRQQINSGLQSQGEDAVRISREFKNCDAIEEDCSIASMSRDVHTRSRHLTNERLRKNLQYNQHDSLCCEEGFLSTNDQACAAIDTLAPRSSLDWILFSTDSHFPFPAFPSYSISTSPWMGSTQDSNHTNDMNDSATCGPCSPRSHPSGAKPKKYMKKKTKAT